MRGQRVAYGNRLSFKRAFQRPQRRGDVSEPVLQLRQTGLCSLAGVIALALDRDAYALEFGIGPRSAQLAVEHAHLRPKRGRVLTERAERMLEEREQGNGREVFVGGFREKAQERARRRVRQRAPGRVVDFDVPARQFARHAPRQRAIRRDQRGGCTFFLQRLAQDQRDGEGFFRRIAGFDQRHTHKTAGDFLRLAALDDHAPGIRRRRGPQSLSKDAFAGSVAGFVPVRDVGAFDVNALEQLLQTELRMTGIEFAPACLVQRAIQTRQHDRAAGQIGNRAQQFRSSRNAARRTGRDDGTFRRIFLQPVRKRGERLVAARGGIDRAFRLEDSGPDSVQQIEEALHLRPMFGEPLRHDRGEVRKLCALRFELVHHAGQT